MLCEVQVLFFIVSLLVSTHVSTVQLIAVIELIYRTLNSDKFNTKQLPEKVIYFYLSTYCN
jgi:hypothetical protein